MKLYYILLSASLFTATAATAQSNLLKKAQDAVGATKNNDGAQQNNIVAALKEALTIGAEKGTEKLSLTDGFLKNAAVKILLPPEAQKVEAALKRIGMSHLVDDAIESMNRAAEQATKSAAPIFVNAIKNMSVKDGVDILKGSDTAATVYLKNSTMKDLTAAFKPIIEKALESTDATKHWTSLTTAYNKLPTSFNKVNTDLSAYVTERALNGVFYQVAQEEKEIRKNPAARVTDLLKNVFGN